MAPRNFAAELKSCVPVSAVRRIACVWKLVLGPGRKLPETNNAVAAAFESRSKVNSNPPACDVSKVCAQASSNDTYACSSAPMPEFASKTTSLHPWYVSPAATHPGTDAPPVPPLLVDQFAGSSQLAWLASEPAPPT